MKSMFLFLNNTKENYSKLYLYSFREIDVMKSI